MPNSLQIAPNPRRIELLVFESVQLLDVAGPLQVFATANDLARLGGTAPPYRLAVVAPEAPETITSSGLGIKVAPLPPIDAPVDTLIVAGGYGVTAACADDRLVCWLRARAPRARRVVSVCSGAFLLAAAGLLRGRRVATHWARCAELARRHPELTVEQDPIFIRDGDVWTSAGVTAGIDLALALVEADLGGAAALAVARQLVVFLKRPGGQTQFSAALSLQRDGDCFGALHEWIACNLGATLSTATLADRAGMSERSFLRRYREATGATPARTVERLRVEAAQRRLCESGESLKRIAARCGFGSQDTMRRGFLRVAGVLPEEYRRRFSH
jgi:transcriptional regulator GlxA family with amidase domain